MSVEDKQIDKALLVPPKHMPDSHPDTLGHVAVRGDLEAFDMQSTSDRWHKMAKKEYFTDEEAKEMRYVADYYGDMAKERRDYTHDYISRARDAIRWLGKKSDDDTLLPGFEVFDSMSDFQRVQFKLDEQDNSELSVFEWLTEQKAPAMSDHTPEERALKQQQEYEDDQRLLNFFQNHNMRLARLSQNPEFVQEVNEQKLIWQEGIKKALGNGWLHQTAKKQLDMADNLKVYAGDYFTTYLHNRVGYFRFADRDFVSVAEDATDETVMHEMNHALLQVLPMDAHEPLSQVWLFEAITEELTQSFITGEFGEFNTRVGAYRDERELLATILDISRYLGAGIDFGYFTRAYSAPLDEQGKLIDEIRRGMFDAGYPDMDMFSGLEDIMAQKRDEIERTDKNVSDSQKQKIVIASTITRLRKWATVMKPKHKLSG